MSDADLRQAEREASCSGDFSAYQAALNRVPVSYLVDMLETNKAAQAFYKKQGELIRNAMPLCHCGAPAVLETTCEAHKDSLAIYTGLLEKNKVWRAKFPTTYDARLHPSEAEIELTVAFQNAGRPGFPENTGKCLFPLCEIQTGSDYDGGYYLYCDLHQGAVRNLPFQHPLCSPKWPVTKMRGEIFDHRWHKASP